ncbi:serine protease [Paenibacillus dendritiformis]|uniref:serine protease n=1 Tax=Paenibacillus dendritiformis TaxID=130049 RepID=UPI000DA784E9|nr:serine protease [Paenibacillus dendritiformis]PZM61939.1 serine protease [Paenibacillus dendritiformis]
MSYFAITQDSRITDAVHLLGDAQIIKKILEQDIIGKRDEILHFDVKPNPRNEYMDYIESHLPIISNRLKQLWLRYDPKLFFKPVILLDQTVMRQEMYWLLIPDLIDCLASASAFHKNGTVKHLVLDRQKIGDCKIFKVAGLIERMIVIRLDVVESMLRRGFTGFGLRKVEITGGIGERMSPVEKENQMDC